MYKKKDKDGKFIDKEFQTAITPKGAITRTLKALGWVFSADGVDIDKFIGKWAELNIDDYTQGEGEESYTASTIREVNPYKGPDLFTVEDVKPRGKPQSVEKQVKHESVDPTVKLKPGVKELEDKIEELKKMNEDGFLTDDGLKQSVEQLEAQIGELVK